MFVLSDLHDTVSMILNWWRTYIFFTSLKWSHDSFQPTFTSSKKIIEIVELNCILKPFLKKQKKGKTAHKAATRQLGKQQLQLAVRQTEDVFSVTVYWGCDRINPVGKQ